MWTKRVLLGRTLRSSLSSIAPHVCKHKWWYYGSTYNNYAKNKYSVVGLKPMKRKEKKELDFIIPFYIY